MSGFFFFLVSGALAAPVLRVVVPLTGGESLFLPPRFSGHWHAARQYVASLCELLCPAGWQRRATRANWLLPASRSQALHLRHVCWLLSVRPPLHLYSESSRNQTSTHVHASRMRQVLRHGNLKGRLSPSCLSHACANAQYKWLHHDDGNRQKRRIRIKTNECVAKLLSINSEIRQIEFKIQHQNV